MIELEMSVAEYVNRATMRDRTEQRQPKDAQRYYWYMTTYKNWPQFNMKGVNSLFAPYDQILALLKFKF